MKMFKSWLDIVFGESVPRETSRARAASADQFWTYPESEVGCGVVPLYRADYTKEGVLELKEDGEHDLYADIQSHAASTDIHMILDRYFAGDPEALNRVQGSYIDASEVPDNYHEAMSLLYNARKDFLTLPPDIKEKFNNDPDQWIAALGTADWFAKMQMPGVSTESSQVDIAVDSTVTADASGPDKGVE